MLLLALSLPLAAQASFGIKAGINAATVSSSDDDVLLGGDADGIDKQARLGFVGGLTADIPLSPVLSFRPEFLYTQKGYAADFDVDAGDFGDSFDGTLTLEIDYVEVPLLLAYTFPSSSALEVAIEAGPTLAYKLRTGIGCSGDFEDTVFCEEGDLEDDEGVSDFDLGGAIGATVGAGPFGVGLRYTNSLLSIAEDGDDADDDDFSVRNQVFSVTAHYRFGR